MATERVKQSAVRDYHWSYAGRHRFKGVRDEVAVHRVRRARVPEAG